jgi:hypothetical protein
MSRPNDVLMFLATVSADSTLRGVAEDLGWSPAAIPLLARFNEDEFCEVISLAEEVWVQLGEGFGVVEQARDELRAAEDGVAGLDGMKLTAAKRRVVARTSEVESSQRDLLALAAKLLTKALFDAEVSLLLHGSQYS